MSEVVLVDLLGMIAGAVWLSAACYFQLIRHGDVHPAYVSVLALIGVALMMGSASLTTIAPGLTELLGIVANVIFILLGLGFWVALEQATSLRERKQHETSLRPRSDDE